MIGLCLPRYPIDIQTRFQYFTRLQGPNTRVECFWRRDVEKSCEIINRLPVGSCIDTGQSQKRSDFTSKGKPISSGRIKKRLNPETVSRQNQSPASRVINCESKHAPQLPD